MNFDLARMGQLVLGQKVLGGRGGVAHKTQVPIHLQPENTQIYIHFISYSVPFVVYYPNSYIRFFTNNLGNISYIRTYIITPVKRHRYQKKTKKKKKKKKNLGK